MLLICLFYLAGGLCGIDGIEGGEYFARILTHSAQMYALTPSQSDPTILISWWQAYGLSLSLLILFLAALAASWYLLSQNKNLKKNLAEARRQQQQLEMLLDEMPDVLILKDGQGRWQVANQTALHLFRLDGQDWRGKTDVQLRELQDQQLRRAHEFCIKSDETAWSQAKTSHFAETLLYPDGQLGYFDIAKIPLFDTQQQARALLVVGRDVTQSHAAEQRLQYNEARFRNTFELAAVGIAHIAPNGEFILINQPFCDLVGYNREEMLRLKLQDVTHPEDIAEDLEYIQQALAGLRDIHRSDKRYLHKNGAQVWVRLTVSLERHEDSHPTHFIAIAENINETKLLQEALQDQQRRYQDLLETTEVIIWEMCLEDFCFTYVSPQIEQKLGYPLEHWQRSDFWLRCLYPDDRSSILECYRQPDAYRLAQTLEFRMRNASGEYIWLHNVITALNNDQHVTRLRGVMFDINALKLAEAEAEEANQLLRQEIQERTQAEIQLQSLNRDFVTFLENTSDFIYFKDKSNSLRFCSQSLAELVGYEHWQDMIGRRESGLFCCPCDPLEVCEEENVFATAQPLLNRITAYTKCNGEQAWINSSKWPVVDENGEVLGLFGISRDITQQQQMQDELRAAKEQAESANRAKSAFLANMSHELRTPLNSVLGFAQILEHAPGLTAEQRRHVQSIRRGGDYLLTLINDILDLAKIEAGRFDVFFEPFDLPGLFYNLFEIFHIRAQQRQIAFRLEGKESLPEHVLGDQKRLRQILMNLLSNALKFTQEGEVVLRVKFIEGILYVQVQDTGIGMNAEELALIFRPFTQVGMSEYRTQGTGLGLAITCKLVDLLEGELSVDSQQGKGSVFSLHLPLQVLQTPLPKASKPPPIIGYERNDHSCAALQILVVDDESENRKVLVDLLTPLGFVVLEADNGYSCLEQAQQWLPDLILLDLRMPELNGIETTRRLRASQHMQHIPIITISASAFAENQRASHAAGCSAHLSKPLKISKLFELIAYYLPLEWIHAPRTGKTEQSAPELKLSQQQHQTLSELLEMGDISQIIVFLEELQQTPDSPAGVDMLLELAQSFNIVELRYCLLQQPPT